MSEPWEGVSVWSFLWRPDGSEIAADIVTLEKRRMLRLVDVRSGEYQDLAEIAEYGELQPLEWSPDGQHLLFNYLGGRGVCDDGPPVATPTHVEVIP